MKETKRVTKKEAAARSITAKGNGKKGNASKVEHEIIKIPALELKLLPITIIGDSSLISNKKRRHLPKMSFTKRWRYWYVRF